MGKKKRPPARIADAGTVNLMIKGAIIQERQKMIAIITHDMTTVNLMVLHDKFGFSREQLDEYLEKLTDLWEGVIGQYVECEDLENCPFEETGIDRRVIRGKRPNESGTGTETGTAPGDNNREPDQGNPELSGQDLSGNPDSESQTANGQGQDSGTAGNVSGTP